MMTIAAPASKDTAGQFHKRLPLDWPIKQEDNNWLIHQTYEKIKRGLIDINLIEIHKQQIKDSHYTINRMPVASKANLGGTHIKW